MNFIIHTDILNRERARVAARMLYCVSFANDFSDPSLIYPYHCCEAMLFGFLTTDANAVVKPIHPKAMPVILTTEAEIERWMTAPAAEALELQRPLPDDALEIVAQGERQDGIAA